MDEEGYMTQALSCSITRGYTHNKSSMDHRLISCVMQSDHGCDKSDPIKHIGYQVVLC